MNRQTVGVGLLAASIGYSIVDLGGWLHPTALRWRAHGGIERAIAIVLGSLTFKTIVLATALVLAFWPVRQRP